jgi:RadC-like JAB domain
VQRWLHSFLLIRVNRDVPTLIMFEAYSAYPRLSLAESLLEAAQVMNIPVLDHVILGGSNYVSLR